MINQNIEVTPRKGRHFLLEWHLWIPVLILAFVTAIFRLYPLDMQIQTYYFKDSWHLGKLPLWQLIYRYGNLHALLVAIHSLYGLARSFGSSRRYRIKRKLYLYLVLVLVIGPGLIVNSLLKDHWGRLRPRDLIEFGGDYRYEEPLTYDPASPGKSFPCGHATMGFYFYAVAFVYGIRKRKAWSACVLGATAYGSLIGWVRMIQGGHFAIDVIWAGSIIYLCSWLLWKLMKMDHEPLYLRDASSGSLKTWHKMLFVTIGLVIATAVSLATPYSTSQNLQPTPEQNYHLEISIRDANIELGFSDSLFISNQAQGFGFPSSKARLRTSSSRDSLSIVQNLRGFFTELDADIRVIVDTLHCESMLLSLDEGMVLLDLPETFQDRIMVQTSQLDVPHPQIVRSDDSARFRINSPVLKLKTNNAGQNWAVPQIAPKHIKEVNTMKKGLIVLLVILLIILVFAGWFIGRYNTIQREKVTVETAWAQVENVYQTRYDLVPNLVNTVQGAANFERETLTAVTEARASMGGQVNLPPEALSDPTAFQQFQANQAGLSSALSRLMVVVEKYPELKANQNFLTFQSQLEGIESRIRVERMRYNEAAKLFNQMIVVFPNNIIAGMIGAKSFQFFSAEAEAQKAPTVQFD